MLELPLTEYGWVRSEDNNTHIRPLWYEGNQLPPSLRRQKRTRKKKQGSDSANDESDSIDKTELPPTKKVKITKSKKSPAIDSAH